MFSHASPYHNFYTILSTNLSFTSLYTFSANTLWEHILSFITTYLHLCNSICSSVLPSATFHYPIILCTSICLFEHFLLCSTLCSYVLHSAPIHCPLSLCTSNLSVGTLLHPLLLPNILYLVLLLSGVLKLNLLICTIRHSTLTQLYFPLFQPLPFKLKCFSFVFPFALFHWPLLLRTTLC